MPDSVTASLPPADCSVTTPAPPQQQTAMPGVDGGREAPRAGRVEREPAAARRNARPHAADAAAGGRTLPQADQIDALEMLPADPTVLTLLGKELRLPAEPTEPAVSPPATSESCSSERSRFGSDGKMT